MDMTLREMAIGLGGPVVAFFLLGVAGAAWMLFSSYAEEREPRPVDRVERGAVDGRFVLAVALGTAIVAASLGVADALLALAFGGGALGAAGAGAVAGAAAAPVVVLGHRSGVVRLPVLTVPFVMNLVAVAALAD